MTLKLPEKLDIPKAFRDAFKMTWAPPEVPATPPIPEPVPEPVRVKPGEPTILLEITPRHIRQGVPGDTSGCAVAMAIQELVGPAYHVGVSGSGITIRTERHPYASWSYVGGDRLQLFVHKFDSAFTQLERPGPTTILLQRYSRTKYPTYLE